MSKRTLAIIPALTVECAGERYAVPQVSLEELLWVKGVTASLYYGYDSSGTPAGDAPRLGLREIFTVDSPIDRVNLRTAVKRFS